MTESDPTIREQADERKTIPPAIPGSLLLTPECQNLWLLSPKPLLLYEQAFIDQQDLAAILHPRKDTLFAAIKARSAEKLVSWGLLQSIDYQSYLAPESRAQVHRIASETVRRYLPPEGQLSSKSKFYTLSIYTHEKYAAYLEQTIYACPSQDETEMRTHVTRLNAVQTRLDRLRASQIDDALCDELTWTLERITAKAVAGLFLSCKTGISRLYDTDEYSPFVQDALASEPGIVTVYDPELDIPAVTASVAALSRKALPDVTIADEYRMFAAIRDKSEFLRLRKVLRNLETIFGELLKERSDTVQRKLIIETDRLTAELNERFEEVRTSLGERTKWISIEMLAGQIAGFLSPWIDIAKDSWATSKLNQLRSAFISRQDLVGDLFFLMEVCDRFRVLDDERFRQIINERDKDTIWGQDKSDVPWYEKAPSKSMKGDKE
jgi:hypothetical protein